MEVIVNIFDTHAHYDDEAFNEDRFDLLSVMPENNVKYIINQGVDIKSSLDSIELSEKYSYIYAAVGIHPLDVKKMEDVSKISELAKHEKVVAIGEIGLDYYYETETKDLQLKYFKSQLNLANELNLPVVIHDRDAHKDTLDTLKEIKGNNLGVIHCYSGSLEMAKELLKLGYSLGFDGPVTFNNAKTVIEVLKYIPLDRILIETDAPYLTPVPFRGKRNNSMYLTYIIEAIAKIKEISPEEMANITLNNAKTLFKIS